MTIGGDKQYTSDIIFIMLTSPDYNVDNNIVGYLFGADIMKNDPKEYEESIKTIVDEFELRNNLQKMEIISNETNNYISAIPSLKGNLQSNNYCKCVGFWRTYFYSEVEKSIAHIHTNSNRKVNGGDYVKLL